MYEIRKFGLAEAVELGAKLRGLALVATSMEDVAEGVVRMLHEGFGVGDTVRGPRTFSLVRFYKSHPHGLLPERLQRFANDVFPDERLNERTRCLTLLATRGFEEAWRSRTRSVSHQAIPLPRKEVVERLPMLAELLRQFGIDVPTLLGPDPSADLNHAACGVFYVPTAPGSPFVPAQRDFVERYRIQSVIGFGGLLPGGDLFAVLLFSASPIDAETAELFRSIALNVKMAILPFTGRVFS